MITQNQRIFRSYLTYDFICLSAILSQLETLFTSTQLLSMDEQFGRAYLSTFDNSRVCYLTSQI